MFASRADEVVQAVDVTPGTASSQELARVLPTKPQMPVMSIFMVRIVPCYC